MEIFSKNNINDLLEIESITKILFLTVNASKCSIARYELNEVICEMNKSSTLTVKLYFLIFNDFFFQRKEGKKNKQTMSRPSISEKKPIRRKK